VRSSNRAAKNLGRSLWVPITTLAFTAWTHAFGAELIVKAEGTDHALPPREEKRSTDGATSTYVVFRARDRAFRYTPPSGWQVKIGSNRAVLSHGATTATIGLLLDERSSARNAGPPTPEELKLFQQETAARIPAMSVGPVTLSVLPFKIGDHVVIESTARYSSGAQPRALQRIKTCGGSWRMEAEISAGPDFDKIANEFVRSLCSIDAETSSDPQVVERERSAVTERENKALAQALHTGGETARTPTRGHIPDR
jgi:hypothetical protein